MKRRFLSSLAEMIAVFKFVTFATCFVEHKSDYNLISHNSIRRVECFFLQYTVELGREFLLWSVKKKIGKGRLNLTRYF